MEKEIFIYYYSVPDVTPPGGQEHTLNTSTTSLYEQAHKENSPKYGEIKLDVCIWSMPGTLHVTKPWHQIVLEKLYRRTP